MGDPMAFWSMLRWGSLAVGGALALRITVPALYQGLRYVRDDLTAYLVKLRHHYLTLQHIATQNDLQKVREIRADERGRYPLLYGAGGILRDPNNLRAFTLQAVLETWPTLERLDWAVKTLIAMQGVRSGNAGKVEELTESARNIPDLPKYVTLRDLLKSHGLQPSYHRLVLGEAVNAATGKREPVTGDMADFVHVLASGASGWGKSTALEAMAKQLVLSGDCDLCFVDYGVNTFGMLAGHALYPIADTPGMAIALLKELVQEMHRRREAMARYPQVKRLDQYNEIAGAGLRPLVCFVDEASVLLDRSGDLRDLVRELTGMGRKYGLGAVFGGTDFKVGTMPSETRGNCGLRMAFHLEETQLSRSIVRSSLAVNLVDKGRALAVLPGVAGLVELQCPIVERWDDLPPARPVIELHETLADDGPDPEKVRLVIELHAQGESDTAIARQVFKYGNPFYIGKVRAILARAGAVGRQQQQNASENGQEGQPGQSQPVVVADQP